MGETRAARAPLPAIHIAERDVALPDQQQPKRCLRCVSGPAGKARCFCPDEVRQPGKQKAARQLEIQSIANVTTGGAPKDYPQQRDEGDRPGSSIAASNEETHEREQVTDG